MRRDVFQAIADPARRKMIEIISKESLSTNEILAHFDMSKQAIAKHLKILTECGIVFTYKQGKSRYYEIEPNSLVPAHMWIDKLQKQWEDRIDSFEQYVDQLKKDKNGKRK